MAKKKKPSKGLSLKRVQPKTNAQELAFEAHDDDFNIIMVGAAGTGKTFLALYMGLEDILVNDTGKKSIKIFRSAVPTRDLGFTPGTVAEKLAIYEAPYIAITNELFNCGSAYGSLRSKNQIEFISTSYNRGITINNAIIIVDEVQNMTDHEIDTIITRMGKNSRIMFCGDINQIDLKKHKEHSGLGRLLQVAKKIPRDFKTITFTADDIVRNDMIKRYLKARMSLGM